MKKIKITEKQAELLGLKKINEADDSGLKSSGVAMGELVVRVVVAGDAVAENKDRILALIHRHDPDSRVGFFEATGKLVGNIKELKRKAIERDIRMIDPSATVEKKSASAPKLKEGVKNLVKITKEQYNRIFASGLIKEADGVKGGEARVDTTFKKEFSGTNVKNLKPVSEEEGIDADAGTKFNITKPIAGIPSGAQKFGKPITENADGQFKNEIKELIKFLYRKSEELSPFWEKNGITYDAICDSLKSKGVIISKNGKYELSKKLGSPQAAIQAVEDQMSSLLPTQQGVETEAYPMTDAPTSDAPATDAPALETENNYPAGADNDPSAPWNQKDQDTTKANVAKEPKLVPVVYNREITILKDPSGGLYVFYNDSVDKQEYMEYASVPRHYLGKDEDGEPEYDYDFDDVEIDGEVVGHYVNNNLANLSKGEGVDAYEQGTDLVKIDDGLKQELLSLYDKDKNVAKLFGPIEEASFDDAMGSFKDNLKQAATPKAPTGEAPEAKQSRIVAKLKDLKAKELERQAAEKAEIEARRASADEVDEMTSAASSGAFTPAFGGGPMGAEPMKREINPPVVGETTTTASAGNFQYDANALPGIGRNGEFKGAKKSKAETTPQWAGGSFVKQPACSKLNNNKSAENGGCNQGASSLKTVKAKGSVNAPSLGENEIFEAIAKKTGKTIEEVRQIINTKKSKA